MSNSPQKPGRLSDPKQILSQMESPRVDPPEAPVPPDSRPRLRVVRPDSDSWDDRLDEPLELPIQVKEVASFLKNSRAELLKREKALRERMS